MERPRFIDHRGKRILYLDLAHASPGQHASGMREAEARLAADPAGPHLLLVDVTGCCQNHDSADVVREFVERIRAHTRARASVGATGLKRRAFAAPGEPDAHALFDDLEAARDWLAAR